MFDRSQVQSSVRIPCPAARSAPATSTIGALTMSGASSERYSAGWARMAPTTGLIRRPERR